MNTQDLTVLDPAIKEWIDKASYEDLLRRWRFGPVGDPATMGANGTYFANEMAARRRLDPSDHVAASKAIGWEKHQP